MLFTADHGNDPTWPGTDHTRERVPVIAKGPYSGQIGMRGFVDVAASVAAHLGVPGCRPGPILHLTGRAQTRDVGDHLFLHDADRGDAGRALHRAAYGATAHAVARVVHLRFHHRLHRLGHRDMRS
jgi:hypothetical protein